MIKKGEGKTQPQKEIDKKLLFTFNESIPTNITERKKFVADCTFFYVTLFKKQIQFFRGEQLLELSKIGRTEELNNVIRANINCFNLLDTFFEKMQNEHLSNMNEIRNGFDNEKDFLEKIKKEYK